MRRKKYITKGEAFYNKNKKAKKKYKTLYELIKATKVEIDEYYSNDDIAIDELVKSYYKLNSFKYIKNNIALVVVIGFCTAYIGEIISSFFDKTMDTPASTDSVFSVLLTPLGDALSLGISVSIVCFLLYKRVLKDYRSPLDVYILPYEKKVIYEKIKGVDEEMTDILTLCE